MKSPNPSSSKSYGPTMFHGGPAGIRPPDPQERLFHFNENELSISVANKCVSIANKTTGNIICFNFIMRVLNSLQFMKMMIVYSNRS